MINYRKCVLTALIFMGVTVGYARTSYSENAVPFGPRSASALGIKNMETRLADVEDQMRELTGKVEKFEYTLKKIEGSLKKMQEDYEMRLTELEKTPQAAPALPTSTMAPTTIEGEGEGEGEKESELPSRISGTLGQVHIRDGEVTEASADGKKTPELPDVPDDYGLTAQEMYDRAFGLLRQADYKNAEIAFSHFIEKNPKDGLVNNAKYWYAETYYVRGMFGDAAVAFAEAYQHNPRGPKAPDSLLKLAMSLSGVKKVKDACSTLSALKKKYPNASSTIKDRAASEWKRLGCK